MAEGLMKASEMAAFYSEGVPISIGNTDYILLWLIKMMVTLCIILPFLHYSHFLTFIFCDTTHFFILYVVFSLVPSFPLYEIHYPHVFRICSTYG